MIDGSPEVSSKHWHCDLILQFHLCDEFPPHDSNSQPFMCDPKVANGT